MKFRKYIFIILLFLQAAVLAEAFYEDVPQNHPAYDSVYNLAKIYKIISIGGARYFRGEEDVNRYQFAILVANTMSYLEKISGKDLSYKTTKEAVFIDVDKEHWAYKSINSVANRYGVMGGYSDREFKGGRLLTRKELASVLTKIAVRTGGEIQKTAGSEAGKTISRYEAAISLDRLIQKATSSLFVALPAETKSVIVFNESPLMLELRWGGVLERASGTENWVVTGVKARVQGPVKIGKFDLKLNCNFGLDTGKIIYNSNLVWENKSEAQIILDLSRLTPVSMLLGLDYINLGNAFSPSTFYGLLVGGRVNLNSGRWLKPRIIFTYSSPLAQPEQRAPQGKIFIGLEHDLSLFGINLDLLYSYENLQMGESRTPRIYNLFGVGVNL
jgi:hypothetical protein